jgi:hypothetical protein
MCVKTIEAGAGLLAEPRGARRHPWRRLRVPDAALRHRKWQEQGSVLHAVRGEPRNRTGDRDLAAEHPAGDHLLRPHLRFGLPAAQGGLAGGQAHHTRGTGEGCNDGWFGPHRSCTTSPQPTSYPATGWQPLCSKMASSFAPTTRPNVAAAGMDPRQVVRHTLRHTAVTHLVQAGVDLPTVQRVSGHRTLSMVARYAHANGAHIQSAMDKLDQRYRSRKAA